MSLSAANVGVLRVRSVSFADPTRALKQIHAYLHFYNIPATTLLKLLQTSTVSMPQCNNVISFTVMSPGSTVGKQMIGSLREGVGQPRLALQKFPIDFCVVFSEFYIPTFAVLFSRFAGC